MKCSANAVFRLSMIARIAFKTMMAEFASRGRGVSKWKSQASLNRRNSSFVKAYQWHDVSTGVMAKALLCRWFISWLTSGASSGWSQAILLHFAARPLFYVKLTRRCYNSINSINMTMMSRKSISRQAVPNTITAQQKFQMARRPQYNIALAWAYYFTHFNI